MREAGDKDVLVLVLSDRQILGVCREKIEHLRERKKKALMNCTSSNIVIVSLLFLKKNILGCYRIKKNKQHLKQHESGYKGI